MITGIVPGALFKPVIYRMAAGPFASNPLGWILHVQMGNGSPFEYFNGLRAPDRKFSTGWVSKTGVIEQYTELENKPWAQAAGNSFYRAWETEGFDTEPLTPEQVKALAQIHTYCKDVDALAEAPGKSGIGTHYMGGAAWGGHSCPGTLRASQRQSILNVAKGMELPKPPPKPPVTPVPAFPGYVSLGSTGSAVVAVQRRLQARGWKGATINGVFKYLTVDGIAGPVTIAVIKSFQREKGLTVDGVVGPVTWRALWTMPTGNGMI